MKQKVIKIEIVFTDGIEPSQITRLRDELEAILNCSQFALGVTTENIIDENDDI